MLAIVVVLVALQAVQAFVAAMVLYPPLNKLMARSIGAPPERSFSAQLWALEADGSMFAPPLRRFVDWLFSARQPNHCLEAFKREAGHA